MANEFIVYESESLLDTYLIGSDIIEKPSKKGINEKVNSQKGSSGKLTNKDLDFYAHLRRYQAEIGEKGEKFVIEKEKEKLKNTSYYSKIKHVSKQDDNAGYDILSFEQDGTELYVEVKTTGKNYDNFYITQNERSLAENLKNNGKRYVIYRVIDILSDPTYSVIDIGDLENQYILEPLVWKVKKR